MYSLIIFPYYTVHDDFFLTASIIILILYTDFLAEKCLFYYSISNCKVTFFFLYGGCFCCMGQVIKGDEKAETTAGLGFCV
jgi:hypothetical protein